MLSDLSCAVANAIARPFLQVAFLIACAIWLATGYGIDTLTLALSILAITLTQMVLASQRRDTIALHAKLDELLHATEGARDDLMHAEQKTEREINELRG